jgi:ABC-type transport system involved in cytochrome bd biosynthesis fused ATPase/permease subunit
VGAAIFGAIFNAALAARLHAAPPGLAGRLPQRVDQVGTALTRVAGLGRAAADYLRAAITAGIHDVYLGLALAAVATLVAVLVLIPRRFAMPGAEASAGPAGQAGPAAQAAPAPSSGEKPG